MPWAPASWLITPTQVTFGAELLNYCDLIDALNFRGSPSDETITVSPSATTIISIDGGGALLGDSLTVDAGSRLVSSLPGQVTVFKLQPVNYLNIQNVQTINEGYALYMPLITR